MNVKFHKDCENTGKILKISYVRCNFGKFDIHFLGLRRADQKADVNQTCQQSMFLPIRACIRIWCTGGAMERQPQMFVHRPFRFSLSPGLFTSYESNNSGSLPRRLRSQHIYILEQNSSHAISNLQFVYSFIVSLKNFHILWVKCTTYNKQQKYHWPWYKENKLCHYCVLLRLFGIKALRNTDSQLWLHMGRVSWVGEHVCDQVHVI